MEEPKKWRETIDPFSIEYKNFILKKVKGYPHARNDVFYVSIVRDDLEEGAFIKVGRDDIHDIVREIEIINSLDFDFLPEVIEYSIKSPPYIVTREVKANRLSYILKDNPDEKSYYYLDDYARNLNLFHRVKGNYPDVKDRKFFHIAEDEYFEKYKILDFKDYLISNKSISEDKVFVHGDCHYANILWEDRKIKAILDYELSGMGIKEFDMAWAIFLRPGQLFFNTKDEVEYFLKCYAKYGSYNRASFDYYFVLIASHFYSMGDEDYRKNVRAIMPF